MNRDPGRFLRFFVFAIYVVICGITLGMFGLSLWLLIGALVLGSAGFREWVKGQQGYKDRTSQLPSWGDKSPGRMFGSLTVYLVPLSIICSLFMLGLVRSGWTYLVFATIGLLGLVLLHRIFVYGDRQLEVGALSTSIADSLKFAGENKKSIAPIGLAAALPLLCGLLTMAIWLPTTPEDMSAAEPTATVFIAEDPGEEKGLTDRSGFVVIAPEEEEPVATEPPQATYTPLPTYTALPTHTPYSTSTDFPTETPEPADTATSRPTKTDTPLPPPTNTPLSPSTNTPLPPATNTPLPLPTNTSTLAPTATQFFVASDAVEMAVVTYVADGDTIVVNLNGVEERVRYIGIDTPEVGDPCEEEATQANRTLVNGQTVRLEKDITNRDRYGRLLRYVYVGDLFVNAELVRQGWARAYRYEPDTKMAVYLESLAAEAPTHTCQVAPTAAPVVVQPTAPPVVDAPAPPPPAPAEDCDPSYPTVCIPPKWKVGDLDCGQISFRRFQVIPPDPHGFDGDHDGVGCESG